MNVRIEGMENVQAMLNRFGSEFAEKVSRGLAAGGEEVVAEAKHRVRKDTTNLEKSIHAQTEGLRCEVGTNVEYAIYQEFGTYKMSAQPYLEPALTNNKENIINAIKAAVK